MSSRKICLLTVLLCLLPLAACTPPLTTATVTKVIDGDTIIIGTGQRVRYIGIDAPEVHPEREAYGFEAWQLNRELVEGKEIILEKDVSETDKYGRLLRYVYVDKLFVNGELVRRGLAEAKAYPPDTKNQKHLEGLEAVAQEAKRGMWAK
ncbi:Thermonuclease [subsurface metagenome]